MEGGTRKLKSEFDHLKNNILLTLQNFVQTLAFANDEVRQTIL